MQNGTGTVNLRATMSNSDHHFWPGQFVDVKLVLATEKGAVLIPNQATQISQQGPFVYVVKSDDTAELRPVKLGQRQGDEVVVTAGVAAERACGARRPNAGSAGRQGARRRQLCCRARFECQWQDHPESRRAVVNLSEVFIRRPVMTVALTVSVILFGVLAYFRLPVSDLPAIDYPVIQVQVNYPGATPETMANNVATPLERQFMQIPGLELVTSNNGQGHSSFVLQFDLSKSLDGAATDVQAAITRAQGQLPVDLPSPPTFTKTNPNDQPIMYIALVSDTVTEGQLYDYANTQVGERISILPGVSQVAVYGTQSAVRIKADPSDHGDPQYHPRRSDQCHQERHRLHRRRPIRRPASHVPVAASGSTDYRRPIQRPDRRTKQRCAGLSERCCSAERRRAGRAHRHALLGARLPAARRNRRGRRISPRRCECSGSREVRARTVFPPFNRSFPARLCVVPAYDRSQTIVGGIKDVQTTLYIAFVLVVMVIFIFLGRATDTLIPAVALPLSLLLTFIAMKMLGYSLDNLSLMALTLAIGFLVDDAIVFLENTVRLMEDGLSAFDASLESAKEISFTILAMTLSLAAVFIPLVFMSGLMGRIFREFSITIVISILASGIVSLTLTPLMTSRLLSNRGEGAKKTWMERVFGAFERRVLDVYGRYLWFFLRNRWISAVTWVVCLAGTAYLFYVVPKAFLPVGDSSFIRGVLVAQEGTSPDQMHAYQTQAEKIMKANPAVRSTFTMSGNASFLGSNQAFLIAFLKDPKERAPIDQVAGQLMGGIAGTIPGVVAFLQPNPALEISTGATANAQGQFAFALSGIDPNEVYATAGKMMAKMREYPGFLFVNSDLYNHTPNLQVDILRDQAKLYGVSETRILTLLHDAYSQNYSYLIKKATDQYQVILEVADDERSAPEDLSKLYIKSDDGQRMVPLSAVTSSHPVIGPQAVNHINQFTSVTMFFNLKPGYAIGPATQFVEQTAKQILPPGIQGIAARRSPDVPEHGF